MELKVVNVIDETDKLRYPTRDIIAYPTTHWLNEFKFNYLVTRQTYLLDLCSFVTKEIKYA